MQEPFLEFAKAYVRHNQYNKERVLIKSLLLALRFVHAALKELHGTPDILKVDGSVQELVFEKLIAWYGSKRRRSTHYIGLELMKLYTELRERGIHPALPHWQSPWKSENRSSSMDPAAVAWRKDKTPDDRKLAAVLVAFELAETDKDQYWTSLSLMLAFASSRGGELVDLRVDSLIDEHYTDRYGRTKRRVGLRWFSAKGFGANIKWVPRLPNSNGNEIQESRLMDMVARAFMHLLRLSEPARKAAKLAYDTNGTVFPIHELCITSKSYPQDRVLNDMETAHAMCRTANLDRTGRQFWPNNRTSRQFFSWHLPCVQYGNPTYKDIAQADYLKFKNKLSHWPYTSNSERVEVWESLVLHQWNQFHDGAKSSVYPNSYCLITTTQLCNQLSGKWEKGENTVMSLFARLGLTMDDGSPIRLTTHDFRRWHGTRGRALAFKGLSEHRLRMLAGRQDIFQNDTYDFNTPVQKAAQYRQLIGTTSSNLPLDKRLNIGIPIYRHELLRRELREHEVPQPIQVGEFGGCTHSISEPPCLKGGDCLTCSEKKYIKGTSGCLERLREAASHHKAEFDALEAWQKKRDQLGIDQWMTYNVIRYAVAESIIQQMEDPSIANGTVLGVDEHFDPSPLKVNLMAKGIEVPEKSQDRVTQEINQLLGVVDGA
ncbi:hypothetical protein [Vreelandella piezotolerans]|uniref:Integrase n=1 Tax=Vreelandella piezotolerans TaxID=2609667 RepID=A0ABQ6XA58_9GAMM|nr:hypothetical protein [Halomonas piezotolerans]KAE8438442.1 hypothetical protein F1978_08835 [Halomonas piezotolerans]QJA22873.1 hypothetical protein GYM47_01455 [Halomonas piezotolerans]